MEPPVSVSLAACSCDALQAASLIDWQTRCVYCESCGGKTQVVEGGHKRICTTETCTVKKDIRNTSYPRVDPTVIMAVISPDGTAILLGHGKRHPRGMWSCLAGFMEPGESVEDAVKREVFEEVGVHVGHVQYHSSQPWPFPTQLMIGCLAFATTAEITIDKKELEGAAWFPNAQVQQMAEHKHPEGFFFPPSQAIAHHLIKHWLRSPSSKM